MYRKGERTTWHRAREYQHKVDVPIPGDGLRSRLNDIEAHLKSCRGRTETGSADRDTMRVYFELEVEELEFAAAFSDLAPWIVATG
ncbi:MAG: hypothetical protein HYR63_06210 [Proteobacteria bacterium]|nr:hypothetical protein [Pseudomonadota bacterium]